MDESNVSHYLEERFDHVQVVETGVYTFFYYNPDPSMQGQFYFATISHDDTDYDSVSNLWRHGVFRLNIGVSKARAAELLRSDAASEHDYTVLNELLPHPHYASAGWISILNPTRSTFDTVVAPLLSEAYELMARRHAVVARTRSLYVGAHQGRAVR